MYFEVKEIKNINIDLNMLIYFRRNNKYDYYLKYENRSQKIAFKTIYQSIPCLMSDGIHIKCAHG